MVIFSAVVSARDEALMTKVRSAEARPLPIWRAVSSNSDDTSASSLPGSGFRPSTGKRPCSWLWGRG